MYKSCEVQFLGMFGIFQGQRFYDFLYKSFLTKEFEWVLDYMLKKSFKKKSALST